mmetsp:Transcript_36604/g.67292  ORF Transcript_36604/g.67292 Transcript_36604/m.67292 type:complete len:158 (-) Transcript_36604:482-955(-)
MMEGIKEYIKALSILALCVSAISFFWVSTFFQDGQHSNTTPVVNLYREEEEKVRWVDSSCFEPLTEPVIRNKKLGKIINVGFPKCGSSTLQSFLDSSNSFNVSHYHPCKGEHKDHKDEFCGLCIRNAVNKKKTASCVMRELCSLVPDGLCRRWIQAS